MTNIEIIFILALYAFPCAMNSGFTILAILEGNEDIKLSELFFFLIYVFLPVFNLIMFFVTIYVAFEDKIEKINWNPVIIKRKG